MFKAVTQHLSGRTEENIGRVEFRREQNSIAMTLCTNIWKVARLLLPHCTNLNKFLNEEKIYFRIRNETER